MHLTTVRARPRRGGRGGRRGDVRGGLPAAVARVAKSSANACTSNAVPECCAVSNAPDVPRRSLPPAEDSDEVSTPGLFPRIAIEIECALDRVSRRSIHARSSPRPVRASRLARVLFPSPRARTFPRLPVVGADFSALAVVARRAEKSAPAPRAPILAGRLRDRSRRDAIGRDARCGARVM